MKDLWGNEITEIETPTRGKYQLFRRKNHYIKSLSEKNCGTCEHSVIWEYHNKRYWKCKEMGFSHSEATDIRKSYVCNLWRKEEKP